MNFLKHQIGSCVAVNGENRKLPDLIEKIFICVPKKNESLKV